MILDLYQLLISLVEWLNAIIELLRSLFVPSL